MTDDAAIVERARQIRALEQFVESVRRSADMWPNWPIVLDAIAEGLQWRRAELDHLLAASAVDLDAEPVTESTAAVATVPRVDPPKSIH